MKISEYTSRKIARLSIVCAILVVYLHSYSKGLSASMSGSFAWWVQDLVSQGISRAAVPFFFVVSGFLLFKDFPKEGIVAWWLRKLRKRLKTLCVPYFAWSLFGLLSTFVMTRFASTQIYSYDVASPTWWLEVLGITTPPKFMFHLWFVKAIFLFAVFSPLIAAIVFRLPKTALLLLFISSVFRFRGLGDWPSNLMFFVMGMVAARNYSTQENIGQDNRVERVERVDSLKFVVQGLKSSDKSTRFCTFCTAKIVVVTWFVLVFLKVLMTRLGFVDIYGAIRLSDMFEMNLMVPINMFGVAALWIGYDKLIGRSAGLAGNLCDHIVPLAFFVYCSHWMILLWTGAIMKRVMPFQSAIIMWLMPPTLTVVIAVLMGELMRRKLICAYRILAGGRG